MTNRLWFLLVAIVPATIAGCSSSNKPLAIASALPHLSRPLPRSCALCGERTVTVGSIDDDRSQPSKNISVWNRSVCGNAFFDQDSPICVHCWHAYSPRTGTWKLSLEDPKAFQPPLEQRIVEFPLPEPAQIRTRVVYSQKFNGVDFDEGIGFWCTVDDSYLAAARSYASRNSLKLDVERDRLDYAPNEVFVRVAKPN